jgi:hypothetical protein
MAYSHIWEPHGVHLKIWGDTSGDEVDTAIDLIRRSPELPKLLYVISDFLEVNEFRVTNYQTLIVAAHDHWVKDLVNRQLKIALVGSKEEVLAAFQLYATSPLIQNTLDVRVFMDLDEARSWVVPI